MSPSYLCLGPWSQGRQACRLQSFAPITGGRAISRADMNNTREIGRLEDSRDDAGSMSMSQLLNLEVFARHQCHLEAKQI